MTRDAQPSLRIGDREVHDHGVRRRGVPATGDRRPRAARGGGRPGRGARCAPSRRPDRVADPCRGARSHRRSAVVVPARRRGGDASWGHARRPARGAHRGRGVGRLATGRRRRRRGSPSRRATTSMPRSKRATRSAADRGAPSASPRGAPGPSMASSMVYGSCATMPRAGAERSYGARHHAAGGTPIKLKTLDLASAHRSRWWRPSSTCPRPTRRRSPGSA